MWRHLWLTIETFEIDIEEEIQNLFEILNLICPENDPIDDVTVLHFQTVFEFSTKEISFWKRSYCFSYFQLNNYSNVPIQNLSWGVAQTLPY